jgi:hypothetical protein
LAPALAAAGKQLISVGTSEGVLTPLPHTYGIIKRYMPTVFPAMTAARQQHGNCTSRRSMPCTCRWRSPRWRCCRYSSSSACAAAAIATSRFSPRPSLAILGNAVVCGTLSNPHDRYGARLAWVPLVVAALALMRRQSIAVETPAKITAIASGERA